MSICPSAVPLPQYECIISKPQTFEAPLTLIRCRCVHSLLPLLQLAATRTHTHKKDKNMQPIDPKDLSLVVPTSSAIVMALLGPCSPKGRELSTLPV